MKEIIPRECRVCYASDAQRRTLFRLFRVPFVRENFFLTGGTCLSVFYLSHRSSEDLDLFLMHEMDLLGHARLLRVAAGAERVLAETPGYCSYLCEGGVRVDFVWDKFSGEGIVKYPLEADVELNLDVIPNMAANKLCAVVSRFIPRDIVDLAVLFSTGTLSVADFEGLYREAARREASLDDLLYVEGLFGEIADAAEQIVDAIRPALKLELSGNDVRNVFGRLRTAMRKMRLGRGL